MRLLTTLSLALCLLLGGCGGSLTSHARVDPALAAFIPPDTIALAGIRLDQLRTTPLYRKLAGHKRLPGFDEFRTDTGIDPERDIRELLVASDGKDGLFIARGTFDIKAAGSVKASPYRGYTLYGNDRNGVFTGIGKTTALAGPAPAVRAAIDQYKSGHRGAPPALLARVETLPANAQIWAVTTGWTGLRPETLREMGNAANLDRVLRLVQSATLSASLRTGVQAAAVGDCRTEKDAQTLSDALRGFVGLGRLSVPENQPDLLRVYDGIQVKQDGRSVRVDIDIPQNLADQLIDKLR
jgi:hypothetical protein